VDARKRNPRHVREMEHPLRIARPPRCETDPRATLRGKRFDLKRRVTPANPAKSGSGFVMPNFNPGLRSTILFSEQAVPAGA